MGSRLIEWNCAMFLMKKAYDGAPPRTKLEPG